MSEFDEFEDDVLSRRLRGAAGGDPDQAAGRARVHERVRVVRRRRTALATGGSAVLIAGLIGAFALRGGSDGTLVPAVPPPTPALTTQSAESTTSPASQTTAVTSTVPSDNATSLPPPTTSAPNSTAPASTAPAIAVTTSAPVPASGPVATGSSVLASTTTLPPPSGTEPASTSSAVPTSDVPSSASSTTAPSGPVTQQFSFLGNSIVVKLENGALSLVSTSAGPGYTLQPPEVRSDRVKVAFADASGAEARIEVNLINGEMVSKYDESGPG